MKAFFLGLSFALITAQAHAALPTSIECIFQKGTQQTTLVGTIGDNKITLSSLVDSLTDSQNYDSDYLSNYEASDLKLTKSSHLKAVFTLGDDNWVHNYTLYIPSTWQAGTVPAGLAYDYYDEYSNSNSAYNTGSCTLK